MKRFIKYIVVSVISISLLATFGCGKKKVEIDEHQTRVTYVGEIKPLGVKVEKIATHLLLTEEETIYLVSPKGSNVLNNDKYKDNRVEIEGVLLPTDTHRNIMAVESIRIAKEEEKTVTATVTTNLYTNAELGIQFEYPSFWEIAIEDSTLELIELREDAAPIDLPAIIRVKQELSEGLAIESILKEELGEDISFEESIIGKDNVTAIKVAGSNTYGLSRGEFVYVLGATNTGSEQSAIYSELVSSFMFIPYGETITDEPIEGSERVVEVSLSETKGRSSDANDTSSGENSEFSRSIKLIEERMESYSEENEWNSYTIQKYEFAGGGDGRDWVYVILDVDGDSLRFMFENSEGEALRHEAAFIPGEFVDWEIDVEEVDPPKTTIHTVIFADELDSTFELLDGFRYLESTRLELKVQYPSSWFYRVADSKIELSDHPVDGENPLITISLKEGNYKKMGDGKYSANGVNYTKSGLTYFVQKADDMHLRISAENGALLKTVEEMIGTIIFE